MAAWNCARDAAKSPEPYAALAAPAVSKPASDARDQDPAAVAAAQATTNAVAAALGGAIGLERELDEKAAGLRTHMLVSVGSALFTLVGAYGFAGFASGQPTWARHPWRG